MGLLRLIAPRIEAIIACAGFAAMVLAIAGNVVLRFLTGRSLVFTEEVAYLGFGYSIFFALAVLYRHRAMIAVDFIVDMLPQRIQRIVGIFNYGLLIFATGYFCYLSWVLASGGWTRRTAFLNLPYFYINLAPTISFALMCGYSIYFLARLIKGDQLDTAALDEQM